MDAPNTALQGQDTTAGGRLYMGFELSEKNWKLSLGDGQRARSRCTVAAGDTTAVLTAIAKARTRCHLSADAPVYSCYEAGRDGFWLHRWLAEQGIANLVMDFASIEVNRRAPRAKTDRLDSDKLLSMLMRYHTGERRVWAAAGVLPHACGCLDVDDSRTFSARYTERSHLATAFWYINSPQWSRYLYAEKADIHEIRLQACSRHGLSRRTPPPRSSSARHSAPLNPASPINFRGSSRTHRRTAPAAWLSLNTGPCRTQPPTRSSAASRASSCRP